MDYTEAQLSEEFARGSANGITFVWDEYQVERFNKAPRIGATFRCNREERDKLFGAVARWVDKGRILSRQRFAAIKETIRIESQILTQQERTYLCE